MVYKEITPTSTFDPSYSGRYVERNEQKMQAIQQVLSKNQGGQLLDLGCNEGYVCRRLLEQSPDLICHGVDLKRSVVGEDLLNNPRFEFFESDVSKFEFPSKYDVVIYNSVHHHVYGKFGSFRASQTFQSIVNSCARTIIFETGQLSEVGDYYWKTAINRDHGTDQNHFEYLMSLVGPRLLKWERIASLPIHGTARDLIAIHLKESPSSKSFISSETESIDLDFSSGGACMMRTKGRKNQKLVRSERRDCKDLEQSVEFKVIDDKFFGKKRLVDFASEREFLIARTASSAVDQVLKPLGISDDGYLAYPYLDGFSTLGSIDWSGIKGSGLLAKQLFDAFERLSTITVDLKQLDPTNPANSKPRLIMDLIDLHENNIMVNVVGGEIKDWRLIDFEFYRTSNRLRNARHLRFILETLEPNPPGRLLRVRRTAAAVIRRSLRLAES